MLQRTLGICIALALTGCSHLAPDSAERLYPIDVEGERGFIDAQGRTRIPPQPHLLGEAQGLLLAQAIPPDQTHSEIRDRRGELRLRQSGAELGLVSHDIVTVQTAPEQVGLRHLRHGWLIPPDQREIHLQLSDLYREGRLPLRRGQHWGILDPQGEWVAPPRFERIAPFSEGLARIQQARKQGFIDHAGQVVIPPTYDGAADFQDGLAQVRQGRRLFFINPRGEEVFRTDYPTYNRFTEGRLAFRGENGRFGFLDRSGEVAIAAQFSRPTAPRFNEGLARMFDAEQRIGYIDRFGHQVIAPQFARATDFSEELAAAALPGGQSGFINAQGEWIIPPRFDPIPPPISGLNHRPLSRIDYRFFNGVAAVKQDGRYGLIDTQGRWILPNRYAYIGSRDGQHFTLRQPRQFGYQTLDGGWAIDARFDQIRPFRDGVAVVAQRERWGVIDQGGAWQVQPRFDAITQFEGRYFKAELDGELVLLDPEFQPLTTGVEQITQVTTGVFIIAREGRFGALNAQGEWFIAPQYRRLMSLNSGHFEATDPQGREWILQADGTPLFQLPTGWRVQRDFRHGVMVITHRRPAQPGTMPRTRLIGHDGQPTTEETFIAAEVIAPGQVLVRRQQQRQLTLINPQGEILQAYAFPRRPLANGRFAAQGHDAQWGFMDRQGDWIIPSLYDAVSDFDQGVAIVSLDQRCHYLDPDGHAIGPQQRFIRCHPFDGALAQVVLDDERAGYLNRQGELVWQQPPP